MFQNKPISLKNKIVIFLASIIFFLLIILVDIDVSKSNLLNTLIVEIQSQESNPQESNQIAKDEKIIKLNFVEISEPKQNLDAYLKTNNMIRKGKVFTTELYSLKEFNFCCEELNRSAMGNKPFGYIEVYNDNVILVTGFGDIFYINSYDLQKNDIANLNLIKSNIKNIINNKSIFERAIDGIRGIEVDNNTLYLSYMEKINGCYSIKVLSAKLNFSELEFESFFDNDECLNPKLDKPFTFGAGGGKIEVLPNGKFYLSVGDFKVYGKSQNEESIFGKIIEITGKNNYRIVSLGHRNPQGLTQTNFSQKLISTEHGPYAGDEINLINLNEKLNFGWPIVSYGRHYEEEYYETYAALAPLKKPHSEFGFQEPLFHVDFSPFGISDIIQNNYFEQNNRFFVGSLNGNLLYDIVFDDSFSKVEQIYSINSTNRIRDIAFDRENNAYYLIYEEPSKLVVLEKNKND